MKPGGRWQAPTSRSSATLALRVIFFPGLFFCLAVLAINLLGDGLRDLLDPRTARRL